MLMDEMEKAGIAPAGPVGYSQPVPGCGGANLIGRINAPGIVSDDRYVIIGAHYDHLGWHTRNKEAFWGADDNAAAVAIALEVGRALAASPGGLMRSVLICLFDGEEPPFFLTRGMGSEFFARHPTVPLSKIDLMVCMDLVGHALGQEGHPIGLRQSLFVFGAEKSAGTSTLVDGLGQLPGLSPRRMDISLLPPLSDYHPFQLRQVPFLFLTCGRWRHYHQVTDTPDRLDYAKMTATAEWLEALVREAASRPLNPFEFVPDGRDDQATLATLWSALSLLAPWSSSGRDGLKVIERLITATKGRPVEAAEYDQILRVMAHLEGLLA